jgi:hypothetical protein
MLRQLLFIFTLFVQFQTFAQEITIYGTIQDEDGDPVPGVRYYFKNNSQNKKVSGSDGKFEIQYKVGTYDSLLFKSVSFDYKGVLIDQKIEKRGLKKGKYFLSIVMPNKLTDIVVIKPELPDTLFGTQEYSISDFAFDSNNQLVLLTYDHNLRRGSALRLLDKDQKVIDKYHITDQSIELQTDFRNNIHLITEEGVYLVWVENQQLYVYPEEREYYFKNVAPVIDTIAEKVYYSTYSEVYPAFDYWEYDVLDSSNKKVLYIEDTFIMPFYRAEFKYLDQRTKLELHKKQLETGIDKEIWAGALFFTQTLYYDPIYAPLFKVEGDTLLIFDHYKDLMFKYHPQNGVEDSLAISYHHNARKSGWEQPLIQDEFTQQIYALFEINGHTYLREINHDTGQVIRSYKLHFKYVEGLQIRNGEVIYIYRPFESIQKKYLYKEVLKPV